MHNESSSDASSANLSAEWVRSTSLFRRSVWVREEINRHKWYESERVGHDIGWERAAVNWLIHHGDRGANLPE